MAWLRQTCFTLALSAPAVEGLRHTREPNATHAVHGLIAHNTSRSMSSALAAAELQGKEAFSLGYLGAQCRCAFHGGCGCDAALQFMQCIAAACESGQCACQGGAHFLYACHNMSAVCPSTALSCSTTSATCATPIAQAVEHGPSDVSSKPEPTIADPAHQGGAAKDTAKTDDAVIVGKTPVHARGRQLTTAPPRPLPTTTVAEIGVGGQKLEDPSLPNPFPDSMNSRRCWYCLLLCGLSLIGGFALAGMSKDSGGQTAGFGIVTAVPFLVGLYVVMGTDLIHRFHAGLEVGWWCSVLCVWVLVQLVAGLVPLVATSLKGKSN